MFKFIKNIDDKSYKAQYGVLEALKYIVSIDDDEAIMKNYLKCFIKITKY